MLWLILLSIACLLRPIHTENLSQDETMSINHALMTIKRSAICDYSHAKYIQSANLHFLESNNQDSLFGIIFERLNNITYELTPLRVALSSSQALELIQSQANLNNSVALNSLSVQYQTALQSNSQLTTTNANQLANISALSSSFNQLNNTNSLSQQSLAQLSASYGNISQTANTILSNLTSLSTLNANLTSINSNLTITNDKLSQIIANLTQELNNTNANVNQTNSLISANVRLSVLLENQTQLVSGLNNTLSLQTINLNQQMAIAKNCTDQRSGLSACANASIVCNSNCIGSTIANNLGCLGLCTLGVPIVSNCFNCLTVCVGNCNANLTLCYQRQGVNPILYQPLWSEVSQLV